MSEYRKPYWTVFAFEVECGHASGRHRVPPGTPVHVLSPAIRRCAEHSTVPVDREAVEDARMTIEVAHRKQIATPQMPSLLDGHRETQFTKVRDIKTPFDARMAAAGDQEDA